MKPATEFSRRASPFPKPQAICADGATLWVSSRSARRVYALDRATLRVTWEVAVPGDDTVWGATRHGDWLYVVCGVDQVDVDGRRVRRLAPGKGFDPDYSLPCPDGIGSHLSHDGASLVLSQWYPRKLLSLAADGSASRVLQLPHAVVGHCFAQGSFWVATCDAEDSDEYFLERCDPRTGACERLTRLGFPARGLAFDGADFWTNHREANEIVSFRP